MYMMHDVSIDLTQSFPKFQKYKKFEQIFLLTYLVIHSFSE